MIYSDYWSDQLERGHIPASVYHRKIVRACKHLYLAQQAVIHCRNKPLESEAR
jgi:hypothetical protein